MSSKVISNVLEKIDYGGGTGRVDVLLATAITLFPLLIDNIFNESVYMCPSRNRQLYSAFLIMAPSICALVLGLIFTLQYLRGHGGLGTQEVVRKLIPRLFIMAVVVCVTCGCSFIFSKYYVCFRLDPSVKDNILHNELINESRQIGWMIILSGLLALFLVTVLQFTVFYPSKLERTWANYKMMQFKTVNDLLRAALVDLASSVVSRDLADVIRQIDEIDEYDEGKLTNLILTYHRIEKNLLIHSETKGAQLIQSHLRNTKFRQEKQYQLIHEEYSENDPLI